MSGIPLEQNDDGKSSNMNKDNSNKKSHELISKRTLYNWKKMTAIEIQYMVKDKESFYHLYLRNSN